MATIKAPKKRKCTVCNVWVLNENLQSHIYTKSHVKKLIREKRKQAAKHSFVLDFRPGQPPLRTQFKRQGYKYNPVNMRVFEALRKSINYMYSNGITGEKEKNSQSIRLFIKIKSHIKEQIGIDRIRRKMQKHTQKQLIRMNKQKLK